MSAFRPSQTLSEMEADGIPGTAELRASEEAEFRALMATPIAHMVAVDSPLNAPLFSVEQWAAKKSTAAWLLNAAARGARWEHGPQFDPCLVTEAEYDAAVRYAENPYDFHNPKESK